MEQAALTSKLSAFPKYNVLAPQTLAISELQSGLRDGEGYYKLMLPGWGPDGKPLGAWTSAGYLKGSSGPLAGLFKRMVDAGWTPWIDGAVKFTLIAIGLSLILGLFTRLGAAAKQPGPELTVRTVTMTPAGR